MRAADSFQWAAALEWCEDAPQGRVSLTTDQKLREAALLSGFDAKQMPRFQIADIYRPHVAVIVNMTMLVIFYLSCL